MCGQRGRQLGRFCVERLPKKKTLTCFSFLSEIGGKITKGMLRCERCKIALCKSREMNWTGKLGMQ